MMCRKADSAPPDNRLGAARSVVKLGIKIAESTDLAVRLTEAETTPRAAGARSGTFDRYGKPPCPSALDWSDWNASCRLHVRRHPRNCSESGAGRRSCAACAFCSRRSTRYWPRPSTSNCRAIQKDRKDGCYTAFDGWLRDLQWGHSRLLEMTPAVMKELVLSWFHPDLDTFSSVCNQCGLQYPRLKTPPPHTWKVLPGKVPRVDPPSWYDLPEIFKVCLHCGASNRDVTYAHLTAGTDLPWKAQDGWMGG